MANFIILLQIQLTGRLGRKVLTLMDDSPVNFKGQFRLNKLEDNVLIFGQANV